MNSWSPGYEHCCGYVYPAGGPTHNTYNRHYYNAPNICPECGACPADWTTVSYRTTGHLWWKETETRTCGNNVPSLDKPDAMGLGQKSKVIERATRRDPPVPVVPPDEALESLARDNLHEDSYKIGWNQAIKAFSEWLEEELDDD